MLQPPQAIHAWLSHTNYSFFSLCPKIGRASGTGDEVTMVHGAYQVKPVLSLLTPASRYVQGTTRTMDPTFPEKSVPTLTHHEPRCLFLRDRAGDPFFVFGEGVG